MFDELIDKKVKIGIAEPFDFTSELGDNCLIGEIISTSEKDEITSWIICNVSPFIDNKTGIEITQVIVTGRYGSIISSLKSNKKVTAHFFYDSYGKESELGKTYETYEEEFRAKKKEHRIEGLLGNIQII